MRALEPHGAVHEAEGFASLLVLFDELQSRLDAFERRPALIQSRPRSIPVLSEISIWCFRSGLLLFNPFSVGDNKRLQLGLDRACGRVGQFLHVEDEAVQSAEGGVDIHVVRAGGCCLRHLVARDDHCLHKRCLVG